MRGAVLVAAAAVAAAVAGGCKGKTEDRGPPPARVVGHASTRTIAIEHLADTRVTCARADLAAQGDVTGVTCDDRECQFTRRGWAAHRVVEAHGRDATLPDWPAVELLAKTGDQLGVEREGARTTTYVLLVGDGVAAPQRCEVSEQTWLGTADGTAVAGGCASLAASE